MLYAVLLVVICVWVLAILRDPTIRLFLRRRRFWWQMNLCADEAEISEVPRVVLRSRVRRNRRGKH